MMNYGQLCDRLTEEVNGITREDAQRRINRAYRTAVEAHSWSFLLKRFTLQTEASYDTGTVAVTPASASITLTGGTWTTSWVTTPSMRRIRIYSRDEPYDVSALGSTTTGTLTDSYAGDEAQPEATYFMYRDVYPLPADCNTSRLLVLYDPKNRRRLIFFNQPEFLMRRNAHGGAGMLGTPEFYMMVGRTTESTPRPQIEMFPAPSTAEVFHGWYFKRPAFLDASTDIPDWPSEYQDVLWLGAAIEYYQSPRHYVPQFLKELEPKYRQLWTRMKRELDGNTAVDRQIKEVGSYTEFSTGWAPNWRVG